MHSDWKFSKHQQHSRQIMPGVFIFYPQVGGFSKNLPVAADFLRGRCAARHTCAAAPPIMPQSPAQRCTLRVLLSAALPDAL